jgi:hypothetical protein
MRFTFLAIISAVILMACTPSHSVIAPENLTSTFIPSNTPNPDTTATHIAQSITSTSTALAKNTSTPKLTNTRTPVPTFTPAILSLTPNASYILQEWTPDRADLLVDQISSYLNAIENEPEYMGVYGYSYYMEQYKYLAFVETEALLRFPDAQQAERWQWDLCYNLALSYLYPESTDAPDLLCYSKIIEHGLNTRKTDISQISDWFRVHESRFSFEITRVAPPPGYTNSHIILLENNAVIWLLEKNGIFHATGLMSSMFFFRESDVEFQFIDLTGDNYPELVLNFGRSYCCGGMTFQFIYDLSLEIPRRLTFLNFNGIQSNTNSEYDSYITTLKDGAKPGLLFKSHDGDPLEQPCNLRQYDKYYWNGNQFELVETWFGIDTPGDYDDKELCQFAINTASNPAELNVIVQSIQQIHIPKFSAYREVILFRLGEYYAQSGDSNKAADYFSRLVAESGDAKSEWKKSAQIFLKNYKTTDNFYKLCSKITQCDIQNTLKQFIENFKPELFPLVSEHLKQIGVPIKANGIFDFDGDGIFEQWIVVQHPGKQQREFWILSKGSAKIYALFVTKTPVNNPEILNFSTITEKFTFELGAQNEKILYSLEKLGISGQPYILSANEPWNSGDPDQKLYDARVFWAQTLEDVAAQVLAGTNLIQENRILLDLKNSNKFGCKTYKCDQLYYLLGLTNELMGEKQAAVDAYLQLWNNYPDSPYTIMARSKLKILP